MSAGEKAEITIEPEWAYGRKGVEGKYPLQNEHVYMLRYIPVVKSKVKNILLECVGIALL